MSFKIIFREIFPKTSSYSGYLKSAKNHPLRSYASQAKYVPEPKIPIEVHEISEKVAGSKIVELTEDEAKIGKSDIAAVKIFQYEKIDGKHPILTNFMVNVKSRNKRLKSGQILLEGKRLIQDAVDAGVKPIALFFSRPSDVEPSLHIGGVRFYKVPYKDLQFWSDVSTTQGIFGIFPLPDTTKYDLASKLPLTIICDNVRDPGNMGSVLRTAAAVGCQQLFLTRGCVDIWDTKVLRTAAGSHFRNRIYPSMTWEEISQILPSESSVYLADSDVPAPDPEYPDVEVYELNNDGQKVPVLSNPPKRVTAYQKSEASSTVPLLQYTEADFKSKSSLTLVIGGETQGLSAEALSWAQERKGSRVFVPLENGVESLNSGTALGILAYEIRRQFLS